MSKLDNPSSPQLKKYCSAQEQTTPSTASLSSTHQLPESTLSMQNQIIKQLTNKVEQI